MMELYIYAALALLGLVSLFFFLRSEILKTARYKNLLHMEVEIQFHESGDPYDHMRRGSIMLHLYDCSPEVKAVVIRELSFSRSVFTVPTLDKLYFKGKSDEDQLLSASFRVRRHALRRLAGKQIYINIVGWISCENGSKAFKARIPYTVETAAEDQLVLQAH